MALLWIWWAASVSSALALLRGPHMDSSHGQNSGEGCISTFTGNGRVLEWVPASLGLFIAVSSRASLLDASLPGTATAPPTTAKLCRKWHGVLCIIGGEFPSLQDIYIKRRLREMGKISHTSHKFFRLLPSGRRYCSFQSQTSRPGDSYFNQANRLLNSDH